MARRKVRYYPTKGYIENIFSDFFVENRNEVIDYMIMEVNEMMDKNFKTLSELRDFDVYGGPMGGFGLDCGWIWLEPKNKEQRHEWFLDNDRITDYASPRLAYSTQSTTLKRLQLSFALRKLGLGDKYRLYERLD